MPRIAVVCVVVGLQFHAEVLHSQGGSTDLRLIGRVHDEQRHPVSGVEVSLSPSGRRVTTDAAGIFTIAPAAWDSIATFRRLGFQPLVTSFASESRRNDTILVELRSTAVELSAVSVTARPTKPLRYAFTAKFDDVFARQRLGLGTLLDREQIERAPGRTTAELLELLPGIRVSGTPKTIRFARCPEPKGLAVFIDGIRQRPWAEPDAQETPPVEMLSRVDASDIEMIEVYRGAAQIPAVFHWDGCAVVAIWTRWNR